MGEWAESKHLGSLVCLLPPLKAGRGSNSPDSRNFRKAKAQSTRNWKYGYHKIIASFELEGTFKYHLVQLLFIQGLLQPDQVAQSPSQPDLDCLQGWGTHHIPKKSSLFLKPLST